MRLAMNRLYETMGTSVFERMTLSERYEAGWLHRPKIGIVPADQCLDPDETTIAQRDLGLIDHMQAVFPERPLESFKQDLVGFFGHFSRPGGLSNR